MSFFKSRPSSPSRKGSGPSKSTTAKNSLKSTLLILEKAVDGLPIPGLKAGAGGLLEIIKIIDKTEQNQEGLQDLGTHLRRLQDAIISPILAQQQMGISPALDGRINRLANELSALAKDWQQLKTAHRFTHRFINYEDYGLAISDINRKIKESLDVFSLDSQISSAIVIDDTQHTVVRVEKHLLSKEIQSLPRANAAYDDYSRNNAPSCFEGTRQGVLDDFQEWFISGSTFMYVLLGIAGVGKSTIAQTIAALIASNHRLAASFFFSRYESERSTSRTFFPTLAFQLAQYSEDFATRISQALQTAPDAAQKALPQQLEKLIIDPLKDIPDSPPPILIVIDALDECEEDGAAEILRLLLTKLVQLPFIKVFLTTRPETHLKLAIDKAQTRNGLVLHDIEASVVTGDIRRFLEYELSPAEIERHTPGCGWTCRPEDLDALVLAAGQLFIVAYTSERFIKNKRVGDPELQLRRLLKSFEAPGSGGSSPFVKLDALYLQILESAIPSNDPDELLVERFQHVVGSIITLQNPLSPESLAHLLDQSVNYVNATLRLLQSVIVSSDRDPRPRIYHPSFPDCITNATRCKQERFLIETPKHHARLAGLCLDLMARMLKRNMCNLPIHDQYLENKDMPDLDAKIKAYVPPALEYACLYWAIHLSRCVLNGEDLVEKLEHFAFKYLLFWLEVLSLIGRVDVGYSAVKHAQKFAVSHQAQPDLQTILNDAHRLILGSHEIIKMSALHVYYSALPFVPHKTTLWRKYEEEAKNSIGVVIGRDEEWDPLLAVLSGHTGGVNSIALSPDGTRLASASHDKSIRVWDAVTGGSLAVMNGHSDSVTLAVFSPDGTRLASASDDCTARVWDTISGASVSVMNGHSGWVRSIAFSPDGARLASASHDSTVRMWNAVNGVALAIMKDHSHWVTSVVFSPDGIRIASASHDKTVRVWSAVNGELLAVIKGHSHWVTSVLFSPDGIRLVSASSDKTVRVWDAVTGGSLAVMKGHSHPLTSIVFSPDSTRLASASTDKTVRMWDVVSGGALAVMKEHSDPVRSVLFSPDSARLASASSDNSVRVWDVVTGRPLAVMIGHSGSVRSIVFSPEGTRLASASSDNTVRIWDLVRGAPVAAMKDRSHWIASVAFSPDGAKLASGSSDNSVQVWDAVSGAPLAAMKDHSDSVRSIVFSPDGIRLASASLDKTVRVWDVATGGSLGVMKGHSGSVRSVVFSPDGVRLASASSDKTVRVWDAVSGVSLAVMKGHLDWVRSAVFSPDGTRLASASSDKTVRMWDAMTGAPLAVMRGYSDPVTSVVFSPNGIWLTSTCQDKTVRVWNVAPGAPSTKSMTDGHPNDISSPEHPDAVKYEGTLIFATDGSAYVSQPNNAIRMLWDSTDAIRHNISHPPQTTAISKRHSEPLLFSRDDRTQSYIVHDLANMVLCWLPYRFLEAEHAWGGTAVALRLQTGRLMLLNTGNLQYE